MSLSSKKYAKTEENALLTPPMNLLSRDCRGRVFGFLTLFECLRFAEAGKASLQFVLPEVDRRRRDQFLVRPCEELTASGDTILNLSTSVRQTELPTRDELVGHINNNGNGFENRKMKEGKDRDHPFLHRAMDNDDDICNCLRGEKTPRSWYALPSVLERIEGLYRTIPSTHPFNTDLKNLVLDLTKKRIINEDCGKMNDSDALKPDLMQQLSSVTYAHRLHASLLSRCTVNLRPAPYYPHDANSNSNLNDENGNKNSFTVTLERYMGDVLSARCLIGHSYYFGSSMSRSCNNSDDDESESESIPVADYNFDDYGGKSEVVVEGGPSFDKWIESLISFKKCGSTTISLSSDDLNSNDDSKNGGDGILSTKDWYQYWVFFHSALLRISPFSVQQAQQLKLDPISGIFEPFDVHNDAYTENSTNNIGTNNNNNSNNISNTKRKKIELPWFLPSRTYACFSPECQDVKLLSEGMNQLCRHNNQRIGILETTFKDFGPLGVFRGRDRVTTEVMLPHKLYVSLLRNSLLSWTLNNRRLQTYMGLNREYITDLRRWLDDSDNRGVMRWMKLLQNQSQNTRPMTVEPPLVTIRIITLNGIERHLAEVDPRN